MVMGMEADSSVDVRLTELVSAGGCAAKIGPGDLRDILGSVFKRVTKNVK